MPSKASTLLYSNIYIISMQLTFVIKHLQVVFIIIIKNKFNNYHLSDAFLIFFLKRNHHWNFFS